MIQEIIDGLKAFYGLNNQVIRAQELIKVLEQINNERDTYWKTQFIEMQKAEKKVSDAYLRLRERLKKFGAFDKHPSGDHFYITEKALDRALLLHEKIKYFVEEAT